MLTLQEYDVVLGQEALVNLDHLGAALLAAVVSWAAPARCWTGGVRLEVQVVDTTLAEELGRGRVDPDAHLHSHHHANGNTGSGSERERYNGAIVREVMTVMVGCVGWFQAMCRHTQHSTAQHSSALTSGQHSMAWFIDAMA